MKDGPAHNHLVMCRTVTQQTLNLTLTLTITFVCSLIRTSQTRHPRKSPLCFQKIYNNFHWSAIDLHCPVNSQN